MPLHIPIFLYILFYSFVSGKSAATGVLEAGDIIVSAGGKSFENMSHFNAWNYLKGLDEGVIKLVIKRKQTEL